MNVYTDVGNFHLKFGLPAFELGPDHNMTYEEFQNMLEFRITFMHEELAEFIEGAQNSDHAQMFDALLDLVYVAVGTAHLMGYPWNEGWQLVQQANMSKERANSAEDPRSKRRHELDVVKPEGWIPPDIWTLLQKHGYGD